MPASKERIYYKAIRRAAAAVNSDMALKQVLDAIVRSTAKAMEAGVSLVLLDSTRTKLIHSSSWRLPQSYLRKGVLDAEALKQITLFSFEQREAILSKQIENEKEARELANELSLLQRQRAELSGGASQTAREAVVFVEKTGEQPEAIRLAYLVKSCGWSPSYTIRAGEDRKQVRIECNALIRQMTGEDWVGVDLALSTTSPIQSALPAATTSRWSGSSKRRFPARSTMSPSRF